MTQRELGTHEIRAALTFLCPEEYEAARKEHDPGHREKRTRRDWG